MGHATTAHRWKDSRYRDHARMAPRIAQSHAACIAAAPHAIPAIPDLAGLQNGKLGICGLANSTTRS
jgi:hypothetical protein